MNFSYIDTSIINAPNYKKLEKEKKNIRNYFAKMSNDTVR